MTKLFIEDLPIAGKKVLMRVDFNVPLDGDLNVADATRIQAALPSIRYVLEKGGALILMSHLGRPHHAVVPELSLAPVAEVLSALLGRPVQMAPDCVGSQVEAEVTSLKPGDVLLLENLRFHRAEEFPEEDPEFARTLALYADFYINDAFGTAHRKHSSTYTIASHFPDRAAAGYLIQKEIEFLGDTLAHPSPPFYALIGGAKISTKIGVLKALLHKVDGLLIGGGMAYTFLKAKGIPIGDSIYEEELLPLAHELLDLAASREVELILPIDLMVARECSEEAPADLIEIETGIQPGHQGMDIGPKTVALFSQRLQKARTIFWNGPLGVYEFERFAKGTNLLAQAIAKTEAITIVGGGDLIAALKQAEVVDKITHISTGGGATLEYIERGSLPAIDALSEKM